MMAQKAYKYRMLQLFSLTVAIPIAMVSMIASPAMAGGPAGQKSFVSPQQAVAALVAAVRDNKDAELCAILGPGSEALISSGDRVADQKGRTSFLKAYDEKKGLVYRSGLRFMNATNLGSFNLLEDKIEKDEGIRACQQYGRAVTE